MLALCKQSPREVGAERQVRSSRFGGDVPMTRSTLSRRPEFPPIHEFAVADASSDEFRIAQIAELPQLLRRPRVLEQDLVNIEGIHLTAPEAVYR